MNSEQEIKIDIRRRFQREYYIRTHREDRGRTARFVRWCEGKWKYAASGFCGALAATLAPQAVVLLGLPVGAAAAPIALVAGIGATVLTLGGFAAFAVYAAADGALNRKAARLLEKDIDGGLLIDAYKKGVVPQEEARVERLKTALDGLLAKTAFGQAAAQKKPETPQAATAAPETPAGPAS